jgi:hypothetical protein
VLYYNLESGVNLRGKNNEYDWRTGRVGESLNDL